MFKLCCFVCLLCGVVNSDSGDLGYNLRIGNAIDIFANYGDLSQVMQVVSADYSEEEGEEEDDAEPFQEKNIRVFSNATSKMVYGDRTIDMNMYLCDTFDDLLNSYFQNFNIEGIDTPWKAFMGDWILHEIMRTLGIEYDGRRDNCCYVLVKMAKVGQTVTLGDLTNVRVKEYISRAIDNLNISDSSQIRRFMKSYGTHYIESHVTGDFVYQVFKYKRSGFSAFKAFIRKKDQRTNDNLRFYFSSFFLKQVGDIRVASGNKSIESWARRNLKDSQYLYSRPSLLRLHYSPILAYTLNDLLVNKALLGLNLKTLRPLFKDKEKAEKYAEIVENDMKLWEINA